MGPLFIKHDGPNIVSLAVQDLTVAAAVLRKPRSGVQGLDCRELAGGATCLAAGPTAFDVYAAALDSALSRIPGLTNRGYILHRS